jgi:hypothetical protein
MQFPPSNPANPINPMKKGDGRTPRPTPADPNASLFSTGVYPTTVDPADITRRTERGARIFGDVKRGLLFAGILVLVAVVLYIFVTATVG